MTTEAVTLRAIDESEQIALGEHLAASLLWPAVVFLSGDLGAGKTTLVRGVMRGLGHLGAVKSPTYTLMEPYTLGERACYHLDLYRLADPGEIEYLGLRDLLGEGALLLVEWPEKGSGELPAPDLVVEIETLAAGRELRFRAHSEAGGNMVRRLRERFRRDRGPTNP